MLASAMKWLGVNFKWFNADGTKYETGELFDNNGWTTHSLIEWYIVNHPKSTGKLRMQYQEYETEDHDWSSKE